MVFKTPWILLLIPVVLTVVYWLRRRQRPSSFVFPSTELVSKSMQSWKVKIHYLPNFLRYLAIILFVTALAGPRIVQKETVQKTEGIDIVLAIDSSGSMAAEDFTYNGKRYNRLQIVKGVVKDFIGKRKTDRLGLISFAGLAYTVCPLTSDYNWLGQNLDRIQLNQIQDGTAIGSAVMSSVSRLRDSKAKSKVVILLTDGANNARNVQPLEAANIAKNYGVKIYTICAGTEGYAPFPVQDFFGRTVYQEVLVEVDEETLQQVAQITSGKYYRATDTNSLIKIYDEIDKLEKTEIEITGYVQYIERFQYFLSAALVLLCLEVILANTFILKVP